MESLFNRFRSLTVLLLALFAQLVLVAYQVKTSQDVPLIRVWAVSAVTPLARLLEAGRTNTIGLASPSVEPLAEAHTVADGGRPCDRHRAGSQLESDLRRPGFPGRREGRHGGYQCRRPDREGDSSLSYSFTNHAGHRSGLCGRSH